MRVDTMVLWFLDASTTFNISFCYTYRWLSTHYNHIRGKNGKRKTNDLDEHKTTTKNMTNETDDKTNDTNMNTDKKTKKKKKKKKQKKKKKKKKKDDDDDSESTETASSSSSDDDSDDQPLRRPNQPVAKRPLVSVGKVALKKKPKPAPKTAPKQQAKKIAPGRKGKSELSSGDEGEDAEEDYGPELTKCEVS